MKKLTAILAVLALVVNLAGCGIRTEREELYRTDTVIYIPPETTRPATEPIAEAETETTEETVTEATEETVPETTRAAAAKKPSSSGKKPGSGSSSNKNETTPTTAPTEATTEVTAEPEETEPPLYDISGYVAGSLEIAMMDAINGFRASEGLGELSKSSRLCAIASARAYEGSMSWSHTRPNGTGYATVFRDYGFGCGISAECLISTSGGEDAATLVSRWMGSEANRNNLMAPDFTTVGIGIYNDNGCVYIACLLAG